MRISEDTAAAIATHYNSIIVSGDLIRRALDADDLEAFRIWHALRMEAARALHKLGVRPIGFDHYPELSH